MWVLKCSEIATVDRKKVSIVRKLTKGNNKDLLTKNGEHWISGKETTRSFLVEEDTKK